MQGPRCNLYIDWNVVLNTKKQKHSSIYTLKCCFRPTYIYGPGNYNKIENWFFERLFKNKSIPIPGDGSLITQLGHVSDLTDVMIRCINYDISKNNIYNCSGDKGVTIKGLIYICAEVCGLNKNDISLKTFDYKKLVPKARKGFQLD